MHISQFLDKIDEFISATGKFFPCSIDLSSTQTHLGLLHAARDEVMSGSRNLRPLDTDRTCSCSRAGAYLRLCANMRFVVALLCTYVILLICMQFDHSSVATSEMAFPKKLNSNCFGAGFIIPVLTIVLHFY